MANDPISLTCRTVLPITFACIDLVVDALTISRSLAMRTSFLHLMGTFYLVFVEFTSASPSSSASLDVSFTFGLPFGVPGNEVRRCWNEGTQ